MVAFVDRINRLKRSQPILTRFADRSNPLKVLLVKRSEKSRDFSRKRFISSLDFYGLSTNGACSETLTTGSTTKTDSKVFADEAKNATSSLKALHTRFKETRMLVIQALKAMDTKLQYAFMLLVYCKHPSFRKYPTLYYLIHYFITLPLAIRRELF